MFRSRSDNAFLIKSSIHYFFSNIHTNHTLLNVLSIFIFLVNNDNRTSILYKLAYVRENYSLSNCFNIMHKIQLLYTLVGGEGGGVIMLLSVNKLDTIQGPGGRLPVQSHPWWPPQYPWSSAWRSPRCIQAYKLQFTNRTSEIAWYTYTQRYYGIFACTRW